MYDEKGVWQCQEFGDCFNCPFPDCKRGTIPKGMSEKRDKIYRAAQNTIASRKRTKREASCTDISSKEDKEKLWEVSLRKLR